MSDEVRIAYGDPVSLSIDELHDFQGELKSLSKENYEKLKKEILDTGFAFAVHCWPELETGKFFLVDGHQRLRTLKEMQKEGYSIPKIPCIPVEAKDFKEAKRRVLQGVSQYGHIEAQGLYEFMNEASLTIEDVLASFDPPHIDLANFAIGYFGSPEMVEKEGSKELSEEDFQNLGQTCPKCGFEFEGK